MVLVMYCISVLAHEQLGAASRSPHKVVNFGVHHCVAYLPHVLIITSNLICVPKLNGPRSDEGLTKNPCTRRSAFDVARVLVA